MSDDPYARWKIRAFRYWEVYLNAESPNYLGRMYIWLRRDAVDLMDITSDEMTELLVIGRLLKATLTALFQPDHFNWSALGNVTAHCHVHLIPRYQSEREFLGRTFRDERWGEDYKPYDTSFSLTEPQLIELRQSIATELGRRCYSPPSQEE